MMVTKEIDLSTAAVNDADDSSRKIAKMITGRNVPANVSIAKKRIKMRAGRMMSPGVHRNTDNQLNAWTGIQRAA
jgi:hypothetical protein